VFEVLRSVCFGRLERVEGGCVFGISRGRQPEVEFVLL
jgi:hypothetical protein